MNKYAKKVLKDLSSEEAADEFVKALREGVRSGSVEHIQEYAKILELAERERRIVVSILSGLGVSSLGELMKIVESHRRSPFPTADSHEAEKIRQKAFGVVVTSLKSRVVPGTESMALVDDALKVLSNHGMLCREYAAPMSIEVPKSGFVVVDNADQST